MFKAELLVNDKYNGRVVDVMEGAEAVELTSKKGDLAEHEIVKSRCKAFGDSVYFFQDDDNLVVALKEEHFRRIEQEPMSPKTLKPGTKLLVREDLADCQKYGVETFVDTMHDLKSKTITIEKVVLCSKGGVRYVVEESEYYFTPEMTYGVVVENTLQNIVEGTFVKVREDLEPYELYGDVLFVSSMIPLLGTISKVKKVHENENFFTTEDSNEFILSPSMIEFVVKPFEGEEKEGEMPKEPTIKKEMLKDGNLVVIEDGRMLFLLDEIFFDKDMSPIISLENYRDDLKVSDSSHSRYNVTKIVNTGLRDGLIHLLNNELPK